MKKIVSILIAAVIALSIVILPISANADSTHVYSAKSIVTLAKKQYGKSYVKGTQGPKTFDCIGLVCYVFKQYKISIPFTTSAFNKNKLSKVGVRIDRKDLKPGDVVCFGSATNITHVGIYVGKGIMINAMNAKAGVKYCFIDRQAYNANPAKNTKNGKTVKIDGKSYTLGYFTKSFCYGVRIYGADFSASIVGDTEIPFTGSVVTPPVKVTFGSATLAEGVDYTVSYRNNAAIGDAVACITGKGRYRGVSTEVSFRITGLIQLPFLSSIELKNAILPSGTLAKGKAFTVSGHLTANAPITWVQMDVFDQNGTVVLSTDARPDSKEMSIYYLDRELYFSKLPEGTYTYRLEAYTNSCKNTWEGSFRILTSDVTGSGLNYPSGTLTQGKTFSVKGTVKSAAKIKKVTLSVFSIDGKKMFEASANPNAKTFDVHSLDAKMAFRTLQAGVYVYRVAVTDQNGTISYQVSHSFTVR